MASMTIIHCLCCNEPREVRTADVKRGWGKFCNKRCKAIHQERLTHQNAAYHQRKLLVKQPFDLTSNLLRNIDNKISQFCAPSDEDWNIDDMDGNFGNED